MKKRPVNRNILIDIWRIIATILILKHHTYYMNLEVHYYHFRQARMYVEFFFLLSGYFTYAHFSRRACADINEMAAASIRYTWKKWLRFLPYVIPAVIAQYILDQILTPLNRIDFLHTLEEMPRDLFLLTAASGTAKVGPLWYLSAMVMATPLLGMCFQYIPKYLMAILSVITALVYYGVTQVSGDRAAPHDFVRGLICMMLGAAIFCMLEELDRLKFKKTLALFFGEAMLLYTVLSTYSSQYSTGHGRETIILAFTGGITLLLYHGDIRLPAALRGFIQYACDLCFIMYIWQKGAATLVNILMPAGSDRLKVTSYFAITFAVSVVLKFVTEQLLALSGKAGLEKYFLEQ